MADNKVLADLAVTPPLTTKETEAQVRNWCLQLIKEGREWYRDEPAIPTMEMSKRYLAGRQDPVNLVDRSSLYVNRTKKVLSEMVAGMSDVREVWEWKTENEEAKYAGTGKMLNNLARAWWANVQAEHSIKDALKYSGVGGSGFVAPVFSKDKNDVVLVPFGPKDVLPFRPTYTNNVQDWQGVAIRERRTVNELRKRYPLKASRIKESRADWFPDDETQSRALISPVEMLINRIKSTSIGKPSGMTDLIHVFFKDSSINISEEPVRVGPEEFNWSYTVYPLDTMNPETGKLVTEQEAMLYPGGRMVIMTPDVILFDGPNPYWHRQFPLIQISLDPVPWLLLGLPFLADFLPIQKEVNMLVRGFANAARQWFKRGIKADKSMTSKSNLKSIDTEAAGLRMFYNGFGGKNAPELIDGPSLPEWLFTYLKFLIDQGDEIVGSLAFRNYMQLKQMPSADALRQMQDALSPMLRDRVNNMEKALHQIAEQMKFNFAQFYDVKRRLQILGEGGVVVADEDFDPGTFVPGQPEMLHLAAAGPEPEQDIENPDYDPEYDIDKIPERQARARKFLKNFTFYVTPGSFLNIGHMQTKLTHMQLYSKGLLDPWTVGRTFDVANFGVDPAATVVDRIDIAKQKGLMQGPTELMAQIQQAMAVLQAQMAQMEAQARAMAMASSPMAGGGGGAPGGEGAPLPPSPAGGSAGGNPPSPNQPGRPPTFQQPPNLETRSAPGGGVRPVISTSK